MQVVGDVNASHEEAPTCASVGFDKRYHCCLGKLTVHCCNNRLEDLFYGANGLLMAARGNGDFGFGVDSMTDTCLA